MKPFTKDLSGNVFGSLLAQLPIGTCLYEHTEWSCLCTDCKRRQIVSGRHLTSGHVKTCVFCGGRKTQQVFHGEEIREALRKTKPFTSNSTGVKGVDRCKDRYRVRIRMPRGERRLIGWFDSIEQAAFARWMAEKEYWGEVRMFETWKIEQTNLPLKMGELKSYG